MKFNATFELLHKKLQIFSLQYFEKNMTMLQLWKPINFDEQFRDAMYREGMLS
jgi:hypothetical protein